MADGTSIETKGIAQSSSGYSAWGQGWDGGEAGSTIFFVPEKIIWT